jgi:hypothetical protein
MRRKAVEPRGAAGLSLVEVLVAGAVACLVLGASFGWLWTVVDAADRGGDEVELRSSLAFARRLTTSELRQASTLIAIPDAPCGRHTISFAVPSAVAGEPADLVTYAWDPGRQILWRKSSGSYLAQGVTRFDVRYLDGDGREVAAELGVLPLAAYPIVRAVAFSCTAECGGAREGLEWRVSLRVIP